MNNYIYDATWSITATPETANMRRRLSVLNVGHYNRTGINVDLIS